MSNRAKKQTLYFMPAGGNNSNQWGALGGNANLIGMDEEGASAFPKNMILVDFGNIHYRDKKSNGKKIDYLTPDLDDLFPSMTSRKRPAPKAILLTHFHDDHITGLAHAILRGRRVPKIIAPKMTLDILKNYLVKNGYDPKRKPQKYCRYKEIVALPRQSIKINKDWEVTPFSVSHSTPDCMGFLIEGAGQRIIHAGDLKIDQSVLLGPKTDLDFLENLKDTGGVDAFLIDSTKGDKGKDFIYNDADIRQDIKDIFNKHSGQRIISAFYAGYLEMIAAHIIEAANQNRKIIIASDLLRSKIDNFERDGMTFEKFLSKKTGRRIKIYNHDDIRVPRLKKQETFILTDGIANNQTSLLGQIIYKSHPWFCYEQDDVVYMAKNVMLTRRKFFEKVLKEFQKENIEHYAHPNHKLAIKGHVTWPEIKTLTKTMGAKLVVPIYAKFSGLEAVFNKSSMLDDVYSVLLRNGDMVEISSARIVKDVRLQKWIGVSDYSKKKNTLTLLRRPSYKKKCTGPSFK